MNEKNKTIVIEQSTALEQLNRSEIDIQISTAKRYPRVVSDSIDNAIALATMTTDIAETMGYALPVGGKVIMGASIRLAEVVASNWENLRYGSRLIEVGEKTVTAQGMCHDLQKNISVQHEVTRDIVGKNGKRFNDRLITVTGKAACAIALRDAIFKVVPRALAEKVYGEAMKVAKGNAQSLSERRQKATDYFIKVLGISLERILLVLKRQSYDEIITDDVGKLQGFRVAIKEGGNIDDIFPKAKEAEQNKKKVPVKPKKDKKTVEPAPDKNLAPGEIPMPDDEAAAINAEEKAESDKENWCQE